MNPVIPYTGCVLCTTWQLETSVLNGLSSAGRIGTVGNVKLEGCVVECLMDVNCITLGYNEKHASCQLYSLDLSEHQYMTWQFDTMFYRGKLTNFAKQNIHCTIRNILQ